MVITSLLSVGVSAYSGDGARPIEGAIQPLTPLLLGTYYYPEGAYGACGSINQDTDYVVALSADQYTGGSNCYRHVSISCERD